VKNLEEYLLNNAQLHEWRDDIFGGEVKDETQRDRNRQRRKRLLPKGEQNERGAKTNQNGDNARHRDIPVAAWRRFTHQDAVKDEIAET